MMFPDIQVIDEPSLTRLADFPDTLIDLSGLLI